MVLKQRSPIVLVVAFMGLVKGKGVNLHFASSIGQANQLAFLYSTSFSPQNNSKDAKKLGGLLKLEHAGSGGSRMGSALPLQPVTVTVSVGY